MIDLHIHTKYSNGKYNVKSLLEEAENKKISLIAITDYNTVDAYYELRNLKVRNIFSGNILSGIEVITIYNGEVISILGYGFDINNIQKFLNNHVLSFEEINIKEYQLIYNQYKKLGIVFDEAKIIFNPKTESCIISLAKEIIKHPENYKFLGNREIQSIDEFVKNEFYNFKSKLFVDKSILFPTLNDVIDAIHKSGGLVFLANPFMYSLNITNSLEKIFSIYDFDGVEVLYPSVTKEQLTYLINVCKGKKLFICGGSYNNVNIGINLKKSLVDRWLNYCKSKEG